MASRLAKTPLLQAKRQLAQAAVAAKPTELGSASGQVQTSKASNGVTVVSCNNGSPLTTIGVLVNAGSRYETYDNLGASHALKNSIGLSTKSHTSFGVTRNVQQMGSQISVKIAREYLLFSAQVLTGNTFALCDYLLDAVANPAFKRWEVPDATRRIGIDNSEMDPAVRATELLHKAAYREGLGNSLYSPPHMVGKHGPIALSAFHQKNFTSDRACLFAVGGVNHNNVVKLADILDLGKGAGPGPLKSKYFGGEQRHDTAGNVAYINLATDCSRSNIKEVIAGKLLASVLGTGQKIKYASGTGQLQKAVGSENVSSIHHGYSDACLIGAAIKCDAANAGEVVGKVAAALRSANVTDAELKAAKKAISIEITDTHLNPNTKGELLAAYASSGFEGLTSEKAVLDIIAQITVADVQAVAQKLANGKLAMAAVGNLRTVPYLDTL